MSKHLAVLIPCLGRPHRVQPTLDAFNATAPGARVLFIASPSDQPELGALQTAGADTLVTDGGYATKIRYGIQATTEPLIFAGADDLVPQKGWFEAAQAKLLGDVEVVGVSDLIRRPHRPLHATHFLMTRHYAELPCLDGSPGPFSGAYDHSFTDDELIATATHRGAYAFAKDSRLYHDHPMAGGADDDTYRRGRARYREDGRIFRDRQRLWAS